MKNIHILPSRFPKGIHLLDYHITSDEEIKEGEYGIDIRDSKVFKCERTLSNHYEFGVLQFQKSYCKKIILTTDQDLIADGVQAIDDEFLEWFVKNPSCEKIEVNKSYSGIYYIKYPYKIIIPKEEPKQHVELINDNIEEFDKAIELFKQETLEEIAERLYPIILEDDGWDKNKQYRDEWINGAKWQQENIPICIYAENIYCHIENGVVIVEKNDKSVISYSEEEVYTIQQISDLFIPIGKGGYIDDYLDYRLFSKEQPKLNFKEWFEKFKKK